MKLALVVSVQPTRFPALALQGAPEESLPRVAAWGYEGVELAIRDPAALGAPASLGAPAALALARRHGLEVPALSTGQAWGEEGLSYTDPDPAIRAAALRRTMAHIRLARQNGAMVIIGLLRGILRPGVSQAQGMDWLVGALRECCAEAAGAEAAGAEAAGAGAAGAVRLVLEPLTRYETTLVNNVAEGLALIDRARADNLGLLLDTFHMNIEEPRIEESIHNARERLWHVHVADSNRWHPGAGHLSFASILEALAEAGYDGYLSGEFLPRPTAESAAQKAIAHLRGLLRT